MFDWIMCVFFKKGHRYSRWWWENRPEAAHRICEECSCLVTPENRKKFSKRERLSTQK